MVEQMENMRSIASYEPNEHQKRRFHLDSKS